LTILAFVLEHLHFNRDALGTLRLDRGVRDYLVDALRRRQAKATPTDRRTA
jgi:hypothetical protein